MGRPSEIGLDPPPADAAAAPPVPQVFTRAFVTPAALPWDQMRAAQLEARHGAPLPLPDLLHKIRRLDGWAPGRQGRFAVFYVRRRDFQTPFETTLDVDGQAVRVAFGRTGGAGPKVSGSALATAAAVGVAFAVAAGAVTVAWSARQSAEAELAQLEQRAEAKLRMARKAQAAREQDRALASAQGQGARPEDVLADLAWVSRVRFPDARVVAVHWDRGLIALESRGEAAPVAAVGADLVRSERPLRPGVWLWGLSRASGATAAPVAALPQEGS
jgi:hypothetical protein